MAEIVPGIQEATLMDLTGGTPAAETAVWGSLIEAFDAVLQRNVDEPNRQLAELRFLRDAFDRSILQQTCRMLGFDITQDVLDLQTDLTKLTTQLPLYADYNGTVAFEKFIELLLNSECEIEHLWAQVYKEDLDHYYDWTTAPPALSDLVYNGGNWIKTTHIDLKMSLMNGAADFNSVVLKPGQTLFQRVVEIFFDYAPVSLVLRNFWFIVKVRILLRIGVTVPSSLLKIYLRIKQDPPVVIQTGLDVGTWAQSGYLTSEEYVTETLATLWPELDLIQAQTRILDEVGFHAVRSALNSLTGAVPSNTNLPTRTVFTAGEQELNTDQAECSLGLINFDQQQSRLYVFNSGATSVVFLKLCLDLLNPVQWRTKTNIISVVHYNASGVATLEPLYFIEKSHATMFSNFRLKINGPVLGALEHT